MWWRSVLLILVSINLLLIQACAFVRVSQKTKKFINFLTAHDQSSGKWNILWPWKPKPSSRELDEIKPKARHVSELAKLILHPLNIIQFGICQVALLSYHKKKETETCHSYRLLPKWGDFESGPERIDGRTLSIWQTWIFMRLPFEWLIDLLEDLNRI